MKVHEYQPQNPADGAVEDNICDECGEHRDEGVHDVKIVAEVNMTAYGELLDVMRAARNVALLSPSAPAFGDALGTLKIAITLYDRREAGDSVPGSGSTVRSMNDNDKCRSCGEPPLAGVDGAEFGHFTDADGVTVCQRCGTEQPDEDFAAMGDPDEFAQPDPYLQPTAYAAHARERDAKARRAPMPTAWPNPFERAEFDR